MSIIKRLFCKHEYEFVRNIHGDEIIWCGGKRSIWKCKKCGKLQYRYELELPLKEKLCKNLWKYKEEKYKKWRELRKETLDDMTKLMFEKSNKGLNSIEYILLCEEKYNDFNYYKEWLEDNKLNFTFELYHQKEYCYDVNQYIFIIKWPEN